MAVRRCILSIGDLTTAGQLPVSSLTAIDASYADTQTDMEIWNIQTQAWQQLTPGTNSDTSTPASQYWSWESRLREGLRTQFPTETLYVIKHALASDVRDWSPDGGSRYDELITEVTAAAVAANGAGDSLSIDAIIVSVQMLDHQMDAWRSYGCSLRDTIETLRVALAAIADCVVGSIRDDSGLTPVVVVSPHYNYTVQDGRLVHIRMQAESLDNEDGRLRVLRTHRYGAETDGTYNAAGMVAMGATAASHMFMPVFDDGSNPVSKVVGIFGDGNAEGRATSSATLPNHQQAALTGVRMWQPKSGVFLTMQAGAAGNNSISVPSAQLNYSWEIGLGDRIRDLHDVWVVKGSQIDSAASDYRALLSAATEPHDSREMVNWAPGREQMRDMAIRGWMISAFESLRDSSRTPELELVVISVGSMDAFYSGADANQVRPSVESMIALIKQTCAEQEVATTGLRFVVMVPASYVSSGAVPYDGANATDLGVIREQLLDLSTDNSDISVIDLTDHGTDDSFHLNDDGMATSSKAIFDVYAANTADSVEPIFVPSMEHLKKALRLSGVGQDNDALAMIDNAAQSAKSRLFSALGQTKISDLQAIAYTKAPVTSDDFLRVVAVETEIKMVRAQLIRSLPLLFMDGSSQVQTWNDEAAFREGGYLQTENELRRLQDEIQHNLTMLNKAQIVGSTSGTATAFPDTDNALPGDSVFKVI